MPEDASVFESPWFWVPVGVVVVGAVIVVAWAATQEDEQPTAGTSTITINIFE